MIGIVWLRQDLRLGDNPAFYQACLECDEVYPVFIDDPLQTSVSRLGRASQAWLHHSLESLSVDLLSCGSKLTLKQGDPLIILRALLIETKATHLYWNRCYEPAVRERDQQIKLALKNTVDVKSFKGNLVLEPWEVLKQDQTPYRVFTPYWKRFIAQLKLNTPLPRPRDFKPAKAWPSTLTLQDLALLPQPPVRQWDDDMMAHWSVGEAAAHAVMSSFLDRDIQNYQQQRDFPAIKGTSRLSPHLHFGEISPLHIFYHAHIHRAQHPDQDNDIWQFLRQIGWREFSYALMFHFPDTVTHPLFEKYNAFEWRNNKDDLVSWQQGKTGFPIIDAGMRELWQTGIMHNRIRMLVASFLCKNLLIHWRSGEAWFRDTLVDADIANNIMGWQWVAGSGADAAPYYRVFNPILQSKKFDPEGEYIRRWIPELSMLNNKFIHEPTAEQAQQCGYPEAMVDLKATRIRALERYADIK